MQSVTLHNADCMEVMRSMADNSVDLIATDPPYFKVKNEPWDRQWDKPEGFLEWLGEVLAEFQRILRPNGSLYLFASPQMSARVEVLTGRYFNVLNNIRWKKPPYSTKAEMFDKATCRRFLTPSESIIFAEHYGADNIAKGEAGYAAKCDELRGFVFEPLRAWFRARIHEGGLNHKLINEAIGSCTSGGGMASHYFGDTGQYSLPTEAMYLKMRSVWPSLFNREYEDLRREYEDLRQEFEALRRPFSVSANVPFTDVWTFPTVQTHKGKHPCAKPVEMMAHIISASSREGAVVFDPFMGGASTGVAAQMLGRQFIGCEMCPEYFRRAKERLSQADLLAA